MTEIRLVPHSNCNVHSFYHFTSLFCFPSTRPSLPFLYVLQYQNQVLGKDEIKPEWIMLWRTATAREQQATESSGNSLVDKSSRMQRTRQPGGMCRAGNLISDT